MKNLFAKAINFESSIRSFGLREAIRAHASENSRPASAASDPALHVMVLKGFPHPLHYRPRTSDWAVLRKIFIDQDYDIHSAPHAARFDRLYKDMIAASKLPLIIDCGANIGLASVWYATRFPLARIYAIEPEPENFGILLRNCGAYPNIVPVQAAISDRKTMVSLENVGSSPDAWETKEGISGTVPTVTIADLVAREENSALLAVKIDIEGFEVELFRSNVDWVEQAPLVVYESHDWLFPGRGTGHAILSVLARHPRDYIQRGENTFSFQHSLLGA